jgi:ABC-type nickel/cobalt efflux system permease component RcnA
VELTLHAGVRAPRTVVLHDGTFPGRVGWKAIQAAPGRGTAVRSSVGATDPTHGLTVYPRDALSAPADVRDATLHVSPGAGTLVAHDGARHEATRTSQAGGGFTHLLEEGAAGRGVLLLLLLAAFGWGALHALSPGHGKTMVAAYLVGTRGRPRDALALGVTVTVMHTIGVFALGFVTLALSAYVLPEDLYPWLNLASGLIVIAVGTAVLRSRVRDAGGDPHDHGHPHGHDHGHGHGHDHGHDHGHGHDHHHPHPEPPHGHRREISRRGVLAMGASAGIIPCPSALVVLLGAIAQHEVGLGLLLIVAFSAGLAATLTTLGVLVVKATRLPAPGRLAAVLPVASAIAIVGVGILLTVRAFPHLPG